MTEETEARPRGVMIHGSCVSRDAAEAFLSPDVRLVSYVSRQSMVSAMAPKRPDWADLVPSLESAFQRTAVTGDLRGSLRTAIEDSSTEVDLLLMDLVDERNGFLRFADGSVITRSLELTNSGILDQLAGEPEVVPFGTPAHLEAWMKAMRRFSSLLVERGLMERTRIIRHRWALESVQGHTFPFGTSKLDPRIINGHLEHYYAGAEGLGFAFVDVPDGMCVTDEGHQWGMAPFHYAEEFNAFVGAQVRAALA